MRKIIIKSRQNNKDGQEMSLEEFKIKFKRELHSAIQIFTRDKERKDMLKPPALSLNRNYESDFYQDLRWNFNNNARSIYYIDKIEY